MKAENYKMFKGDSNESIEVGELFDAISDQKPIKQKILFTQISVLVVACSLLTHLISTL